MRWTPALLISRIAIASLLGCYGSSDGGDGTGAGVTSGGASDAGSRGGSDGGGGGLSPDAGGHSTPDAGHVSSDAGGALGSGDAGSCGVDTYTNYAAGFFKANCDGCHGHSFGSNYTAFKAQDMLVSGEIGLGLMPQGATLSATEKARITAYISCGAPQ